MQSKSLLRWLYLDFNSYFTTIEQQIKPFLRNKPVVVVSTLTDYTCAIAASYEAKNMGIKTGTMIFEAKKIYPSLICIKANHEKYIYYHHKLVSEINKYIPVEEVCSIDEVACRLLLNEADPRKAVSIALAIKSGIKKNVGDYISCSIGISTNKFLAKTASNLKKPNGLKIIFKEDVQNRINHLKLSDLNGIGLRMERRLYLSGIATINHLYKISPKNMRKIWGSVQGERFWHAIRGDELLQVITNTSTIGHSHVLHPDWRRTSRAREILRKLIVKASSRLRRKNFFCKKLVISLKTPDGKKIQCKQRFNKINDTLSILDKSEIIWKKVIKHYKPKSIKYISITLYDLESIEEAQINMLTNLDSSMEHLLKKRSKISEAIDIINSRFGRDSITIGSIPNSMSVFSGTKVAFTRIPEMKEFYE